MDMKDRIKEIRKSLPQKVTQGEFGSRLGATREMITSYERGVVVPPEPMIKLICSTYNISYAWLKDGIGPMTLPPDTDEELVDSIMVGSNETAKNIMKMFAKAGKKNPAMWDMLAELMEAYDDVKKTGR